MNSFTALGDLQNGTYFVHLGMRLERRLQLQKSASIQPRRGRPHTRTSRCGVRGQHELLNLSRSNCMIVSEYSPVTFHSAKMPMSSCLLNAELCLFFFLRSCNAVVETVVDIRALFLPSSRAGYSSHETLNHKMLCTAEMTKSLSKARSQLCQRKILRGTEMYLYLKHNLPKPV